MKTMFQPSEKRQQKKSLRPLKPFESRKVQGGAVSVGGADEGIGSLPKTMPSTGGGDEGVGSLPFKIR